MLQSRIRRGELDREVAFLKPIKSNGSANSDRVDGWEKVTTDPDVFAKKKDLPGRDIEVAGRLTYAQRTIFIVDYRSDLTTENRIYYNSKVYEIISLNDHEDSRERYLEIMTNLLDTEVWT